NTALLAFGPEPARVRSPLARLTWDVGPLYVDVARLVTFGLAIVLTLALSLFLFHTERGRLIRAAADNPYGAMVIGTDVRRVYATAFGIGAACVGAAGALVSPILPFQPPTGLSLSVTSFNIVIIGGMGSLLGAFIGGYAGQLSAGHAAFVGVGGYTAALLLDRGITPWLGMLVGAALAAVLGSIIGYLGFRFGLRGFYLVLLTVAFAEVCRILASN